MCARVRACAHPQIRREISARRARALRAGIARGPYSFLFPSMSAFLLQSAQTSRDTTPKTSAASFCFEIFYIGCQEETVIHRAN